MARDANSKQFGADINTRAFLKLLVALSLGTMAEWYDFTCFSNLSPTITQLFFPSNDPVSAQLSFWGVYAMGFVARPIGSIIFGHIGDRYGRRLNLVISVLLITLPTLLVGCLPTYAQIGVAAPALMATLRMIQGIALGGELGSAITYLYEVGPTGHKGLTASTGQMATCPGIILGIFMCEAVLLGCTHDQLLLWGWRVPFLLTFFTPPLALYLRLNMPDPYEWLQDRQQMASQCVVDTASTQAVQNPTAAGAATATATAAQPASAVRHHIPLTELLRHHWAGVLLQSLLFSSYGVAFYTFFSWVPSYMTTKFGIASSDTLWAVLVGLVLFAVCCGSAGHFIGDGKVAKVWAYMAVTGIITVVIMPVMLVVEVSPLVGLWVLLPLVLGLTGVLGGTTNTIGPATYPAGVRASGYNLAVSLAMCCFGGLSPLIVSALAVALQPPALAAGVVVAATTLVTLAAGAVLAKVVPSTNVPCPAGQHLEYLEQQQQQQQHKRATQMKQIVVAVA